jgi:putative Holliday junction resolvase
VSHGRILGIDYGSKRVGMAISDPTGIIAQGLPTLANDPHLLERIAAIARAENARLLVVGMPYAPDGGPGAKGREISLFIDNLRATVALPVETWDESHSSRNAQEAFIAGGMKRKQRRLSRAGGLVDQMAARLMLQEYLDSDHHRRSTVA